MPPKKIAKEITAFECPVTGKLFKTKVEADDLAIKARKKIARDEKVRKLEIEKLKADQKADDEKHALADYVRLNVENVSEIAPMMIEKAKEFYDITITNLTISANFSEEVSCSHSSPINKRTNWCGRDKKLPSSYPGFSGNISCSMTVPKTWKLEPFNDNINDVLFGRYHNCNCLFSGFKTLSGCGGSPKARDGYPMRMGFSFFLEDFPKLLAKYEIFKAAKPLEIHNAQVITQLNQDALLFASSNPQIIKIDQTIEKLKNQSNSLLNEIVSNYREEFKPILNVLPENFDSLKQIFGRRW